MVDGENVRAAPKQARVTAVIPTVGRHSLGRAVWSALTQTFRDLMVVVAVDGPTSLLEGITLPEDDRVRIVYCQVSRGENGARMAAVLATQSELIAFLDDDDWWEPGKVAAQVEAMDRIRAAGTRHALITCRSLNRTETGDVIETVPRRVPRPGESVAEYLFTRREIRPGSAGFGSSMFLFDRALLDVEPLTEGLPLHGDLDWALRVGARSDAAFHMLEDVLVNYTRQPTGMSNFPQARWSASFDWVMHQAQGLGPRQRGDALLGLTAPLALRGRDWTGVRKVICTAAIGRARAGLRAWLFCAALAARQSLQELCGLAGRRTANREPLALQRTR